VHRQIEGQFIMISTRAFLAATSMATMLAAGGAHAGQLWPTSVVGTWTAIANQSAMTVTISSQNATGRCRAIAGSMVNTDGTGQSNIAGFYCPVTGRFHFLRNDPKTGLTYQDYSGNVSDTGTQQYMAGIFAQSLGANLVGEYSFMASERKG
jgi:hypothetical protein